MKKFGLLAAAFTLAACEPAVEVEPVTEVVDFELPEPITSNAVAVAEGPDGPTIYSFNGLQLDKSWRGISKAAFSCVIAKQECKVIASVPVSEGRLASAAVTIAGKVYIFGGYTVAEEGDEVSTPELFAFDPKTGRYEAKTDIPTPVDDTVAVAYKDHYIYLISGWHDEGNISLVQLYDTQFDIWSVASEFPGEPVFGHAGGLANGSIIVSDGVAVAPQLVDGKRKFVAAKFTWRGDIDPGDPRIINWRRVDDHAGPARYRMAAIGDNGLGQVIFAGGGDNPYNYNGVGYDGVPAKPSGGYFAYDLKIDQWQELGRLAEPSMDHRALAKSGEDYYIVGGMDEDLEVLNRIVKFRVPG